MAKPEIITGLDIGSSQVVAVVAKHDPDSETTEVVGAARQ